MFNSLILFLLRYVRSLLEEQPCIIDVSILHDTDAEAGEERVLFVCATTADATVLLQQGEGGRLALGALGSFLFDTTPTPTLPLRAEKISPEKTSGLEAEHRQEQLWKKGIPLDHADNLDLDLLIEDTRQRQQEQKQQNPLAAPPPSACTEDIITENHTPPTIAQLELQIQMLTILRELRDDPISDPFFTTTSWDMEEEEEEEKEEEEEDGQNVVDYRLTRTESDLNLGAVAQRVVLGLYPSPEHFATDVRTVWQNCQKATPSESAVYTISYRLSTYFEELYSNFGQKWKAEGVEQRHEEGGSGKDQKKLSDLEAHVQYQHKYPPLSESEPAFASVCDEDSGYEDEDEEWGSDNGNGSGRVGGDNGNGEKMKKTVTASHPQSHGQEHVQQEDEHVQQEDEHEQQHQDKDITGGAGAGPGPGPGADDNIILPKDNGITLLRPGRYSKTIRIARFSIAQHLNQLLQWHEERQSEGEGGKHARGDAAGGDALAEMCATLEAYDCSIEVLIDKNKRKQKVRFYICLIPVREYVSHYSMNSLVSYFYTFCFLLAYGVINLYTCITTRLFYMEPVWQQCGNCHSQYAM